MHVYIGKINNWSDIFVFIYVCLFCVKLMPEISLRTTKSKANKRSEFLNVDIKDFRICVCFRVYDSFIIKKFKKFLGKKAIEFNLHNAFVIFCVELS